MTTVVPRLRHRLSQRFVPLPQSATFRSSVSVVRIVTAFAIVYVFTSIYHAYQCHQCSQSATTDISREFTLVQTSLKTRRDSTKQYNEPLVPLLDLINTKIERSCPRGLFLVNDTIVDDLYGNNTTLSKRRIPRLIHVTSKTRCMPREFVDNLAQWQQFDSHSFVLHNEAAVDRLLLTTVWPQFPHLALALRCIKGGAAKADLYRALILWEYGGIYTDIDNAPARFHAEHTIDDHDDALFVMEKSGILSQYFFAARPRHPLIYLLIQHMSGRLLALRDVENQKVSVSTGPGALRMAFCDFMNGQGPNGPIQFQPESSCYHPVAKTYTSMGGWKVRVIGNAEQADEWVARDVIPNKNVIYQRMNMTYFRDLVRRETKESCFQRLYKEMGLSGP